LKKYIFLFLGSFAFIHFCCKKTDACKEDICSANRITKKSFTNQAGIMGTFTTNTESRWMINVFNGGPGPVATCIICGDIPDSLKIMNKQVVFSGDLKDACGIVDPEEENRFYIVRPTEIK
jgi:hypothetical protein